ncbi:L,D-transpeptidase family protein [Streptomyces sp. NBC_01497]|uniref:L,D-transpeptidase family protein n=1 Tax=Streptomyces sp. NBC_01497 TaxID=2903885 RepID=UPI002E35ED96|nr:L,D-transpeptidase family protein [Streptomyces sp. NBC_01497]
MSPLHRKERPACVQRLVRHAGPVLVTAALGALCACGGPAAAREHAATLTTQDDRGGAPARATSPAAPPAATPPAPALPRQLPGLGASTLAEVPANARQALVVTGRSADSPESSAVLYRRTTDGWQAGATWAAHNALHGWSGHHLAGDLRSPVGVFALTDAGGLLRDPGTKLPYSHSGGFTVGGTGFEGENLAGSFDYVVAINYNREPGTSPLDWTRPLGAGRGGGIWLHVDHGGPTHGCVSLSERHMRDLLRTLDPSLHPVVVMGDARALRR